MNIVTRKSSIFLVFAAVIALFFSGCLGDNDNNSQQSVIEIAVELSGFGETIEAGEDSIAIEEVSFVQGFSFLEAEEDSLFFSSQPNVFDFSTGSSEDALAFGQIAPNTYSSMEILISQAPEELRSIAPEFVTEDGRFSMIVEGRFNGEDFEFRSQENFEYAFDLSPILEVDEETQESFDYLLYTNMRDWFISEEGESLIDPQESDSTRQLINDNISEAFYLEQ